jgi:putative transposase
MKGLEDINGERFSHAFTRLRYHIILTFKYRRKVASPAVVKHLNVIFNDIASKSHFKILYTGFDGDHVHLFVKSCPSFSVLQIVRRLKQVSTRRLWYIDGDYLSRFYYGKRRGNLWTNGYYCSTVGEITEESAIRYIVSQGGSPAKLKT